MIWIIFLEPKHRQDDYAVPFSLGVDHLLWTQWEGVLQIDRVTLRPLGNDGASSLDDFVDELAEYPLVAAREPRELDQCLR
jgi:hypothetical protein